MTDPSKAQRTFNRQLEGKLIAITGGSRGIGKAIALTCARQGAQVILAARSAAGSAAESEDELKKTAQEILSETGQSCLTAVCDVSRPQDLLKLTQVIESTEKHLYGLICAAGIYGSIGPFLDTPFEEWEKAIDINLKGTARTIHTLLPWMKKAKEGRIIVFSGGGQGPLPHFTSYVTSKGGIWRLTESLGVELAKYGIFLNAIAPGAVNTQFLEDLLKAGPEKVGHDLYQKSLRQKAQGGEPPEKAAALCLYLLSESSRGLYGKTISAIWDQYSEFSDLETISQSDLYTFKRVVEVHTK